MSNKKIEQDKSETKKIRLQDISIMDSANVGCMIPEKYFNTETLKMKDDILPYQFKRYETTSVRLDIKKELFFIAGGRYSYNYLLMFMKTAKAWNFGNKQEIEKINFYYNEKQTEKESFPLLCEIDGMYFILAPRVESD
jgi:hypothetical protein